MSQSKRPRGTGSVYKRGDNFWLCYYRNGVPIRESAKTTERKKAEKLLQQRLAEIQTGNFSGLAVEKITVQELADDFFRDLRINERKAIDDVQRRVKLHVLPFFGHLKAVNVSSAIVAKYVDQRQQEGSAAATINRELAALKRMFRLGQQQTPPKVKQLPYIPQLKESNVRKGFVEDHQYTLLAAATSKHGLWLRSIFECGYVYGWRAEELKTLRVNQVNLQDRTIRLWSGETKNDQGRVVTMTQKVYQLLSQCVVGKKPDDYVFTRDNGQQVIDFRIAWINCCEDAGVEGLLFHDLRRTAVKNMVRAGIPEKIAMMISGHKTRSIFDRYAIFNQRDIAEAVNKLEKANQAVHAQFMHNLDSVPSTVLTAKPVTH